MLMVLMLCFTAFATGQKTFPVNGAFDVRADVFAVTNAHIVVDHVTTIPSGTIVVRKGMIEAVGASVTVPKDAVIFDANGAYIYPSFIDLYSSYGIPKQEKLKRWRSPQFVSRKRGSYAWNQAIVPEFNAHEVVKVDTAAAKKLRAAGFGTVLTHNRDGICRGSGAVVTLAEDKDHHIMLKPAATGHYAFNKGSSTMSYPNSLMGMIALLRQTYYDGKWYAAGGSKEEYNLSLEAWNKLNKLPAIFEVYTLQSIMRADKVGDEFGKQYIIKGTGMEYQMLDDVKATGASMIIPLRFPKPYDVEDPLDADDVRLSQMLHWEMAPANPWYLEKGGVNFAITSTGLKNPGKELLPNLRKAVKYGLSKETALKALTSTPASMVGLSSKMGTLTKGKMANFIVTSGDIFEDKTVIHQNWVKGKAHKVSNIRSDLRGTYSLKVGNTDYTMTVGGTIQKPKIKVALNDSVKVNASLKHRRSLVTISFRPSKKDTGLIRLSGWGSQKEASGKGQLTDGAWVDWTIKYNGPAPEEKKKDKPEETVVFGNVLYPFQAYGNQKKPVAEAVLIKNVTVWTNTDKGTQSNMDVQVKGGKIVAVGQNLPSAGYTVVDGTDKHLTSGIIDEHSHICIQRGVNEGSQASSAEVSIADVVNSRDVNMYRQLAGGVTAAQLLHGSANPIGGQSGIIKFKWGYSPEQLKIPNADGFIKFALGENVKQSNWGDHNRTRFPQTRMGVEQVFYDHFQRAKEYGQAKKTTKNLRRDIELDALLEILNKERFVTCHSYRQSEINMLMHVADSMGFNINTFTHILEGYKVADKMREHGVGGSTFSDWWAYKFEVIYAIPHNAGLMTKAGVVTAINSDDAEMGRRLNQEAAKSVKYANLSQEEAWKLVTLNPAKLLHLDDRMGKVEKGYNADIVLWNDNPLSIYAKAEKTWVDGIRFYDMEQDKKKRDWIDKERTRLIQKMLKAKKEGAATQKPPANKEKFYHCDTIEE